MCCKCVSGEREKKKHPSKDMHNLFGPTQKGTLQFADVHNIFIATSITLLLISFIELIMSMIYACTMHMPEPANPSISNVSKSVQWELSWAHALSLSLVLFFRFLFFHNKMRSDAIRDIAHNIFNRVLTWLLLRCVMKFALPNRLKIWAIEYINANYARYIQISAFIIIIIIIVYNVRSL